MAEVKRIFLTGAPGSMWSRVDMYLRRSYRLYADMSDVTDYRNWNGHIGAYWNPGNEPGYNWILNFGDYDKEHIIETLDSGYLKSPEEHADENSIGTVLRIHKSHYFSFHLDKIAELFPESAIVMCQQPNHLCYVWWYACGGHDTVFDSYEYYNRDYDAIWKEIVDQNDAIDRFIDRRGLSRDEFTIPWMQENIGRVGKSMYNVFRGNTPVDENTNGLLNWRSDSFKSQSHFGYNLHSHHRISILPFGDGFRFK
jgi:hypothetical protein